MGFFQRIAATIGMTPGRPKEEASDAAPAAGNQDADWFAPIGDAVSNLETDFEVLIQAAYPKFQDQKMAPINALNSRLFALELEAREPVAGIVAIAPDFVRAALGAHPLTVALFEKGGGT